MGKGRTSVLVYEKKSIVAPEGKKSVPEQIVFFNLR